MFGFLSFIGLLIVGYFAGRAAEAAHFARLDKAETDLAPIEDSSVKVLPESAGETCLVTGNVVVALDYFKIFTSSIRMLFGGRMRAYEPLLERARREAIVRMKQEAANMGAFSICNVRLESTRIGEHAPRSIGAIEVLAYGTAIVRTKP